jgi:hypothetical protein
LLEPPFPRGVPRLLIFQLFHCGMAVHLAHPGSSPNTVWFVSLPANPQTPVLLQMNAARLNDRTLGVPDD